ncbi:MAG: tubulin-like doman-containing protein, partial [Oscillospiraceae bacterium]|nr:tubulin-like doman-containing protein [Oscillospiraceae bacterium]
MATYDSMRVSIVGGGVANANAKAPRDNSAHIFIGLGGTGMAALKTMKQMVYERLESDDPAAEVPKYDRIAFLGVDSDKTQLTPRKAYYDLDPQSEFCNIGVSNIATVLAAPRLLEQRSDLQWFNFRRISVDNATAGAGGVRQMGRYLLSESTGKPSNNFFTKVKETIRNAVTTSNVRPPVDRVYVHLFTGIGGGTGSGTFIDACYLIRKAFADLTITDRSKLYGYFYLPDVNLDADGIRNNPLTEAYIKDNGFAALMEFDYLMSAESIGEEFQHKYA